MTEQNHQDFESLSALMDNEADDLELRRILKSSENQPDLEATWERYHLAQSVLHGAGRPVSSTLSQRIAAQIEAETAPAQTQAPRLQVWQQTIAKFAVAASVAVVVIIALQSDLTPGTAPAIVQQEPASPVNVAPETLLAADTAPVALDPGATQFLQDYLEHMRIDDDEPVITVHIQDSPLFRLVNELGTQQQ